MISNPRDTKESPAPETCVMYNQSFYEVQSGTGVYRSQNEDANYKA